MAEVNFAKIEKKWQKAWEDKKIFQVSDKSKKPKFYVLEMFPYPSGDGLHMGHALNYSIGDVFARFKRMQGFNVLYPMGYDALGLPAENAAIKAGEHPQDYTDKSIKNFTKQFKGIGLSYDWSRMVNTASPDYYRWDQWIFLKMFEKGLAYQKEAAVNWCPKCETVLANEQVHEGKCWRHEDTDVEIKQLKQWFLRITDYADALLEGHNKLDWPQRTLAMQRNWIGKSYGTEIKFEINGKDWPIFTTRPDTLFGVTFMVVSAQHPRLMELVTDDKKKDVEKFLKKLKSVSEKELEAMEKEGVFTGSYAINPANGKKVPVYAGNFVVADYGSGMVMAVPAHDQRDFEFAKKYGIEIIRVIAPDKPIRSYLMGAEKISDKNLIDLGIEIIETTKEGDRKIEIPNNSLEDYEKLIESKLTKGFWNEYIGDEIVFMFKHEDNRFERIVLGNETQEEIDRLAAKFMNEKWNKSNVWKWLAENDFYTDLIIHTNNGKLVNSGEFNGTENEDAKEKMTKKFGKKTINYKLRDWLVSRQRYWGTPIPIIYCDDCGAVPVPEKDLPVKLPKDVNFGKGNPLLTNEKWINVKCPSCGGKGKRETDTMDTFVNSSWYFLRYCDSKNDKKIFDKKKVKYWMPVDLYIGGAEHACMHLIYARFYTKFLEDLGLIDFDEPALRLFHQGMLAGEGGEKMSKSKGNVINPDEVSKKYGMDTARLFLLSLASPDKPRDWSEKGIEGSLRFTKKAMDYFEKVKIIKKSDAKIESKLNKIIRGVSKDIEGLKYNLAIIKIRDLFNSLPEECSKEVLEKSLKLLHPFCPHITEELWGKIGNKGFISLESWPKVEEKKIDEKFDKQEEAIDKLRSDIAQIKKLTSKEAGKVYVYVLPQEKEMYGEVEGVTIFAVNDKDKYDPENKSKKVKPGRPGIYIE